MSDGEAPVVEQPREADNKPDAEAKAPRAWLELTKVLALPLVTLVLGFLFNSSLNERQQAESNIRLWAEMMGRREEADSNIRKDMFNSILTTFMTRDPALKLSAEELIRQQILSLELLAYNFHDSLDIAPLFKDVERRIALEDRATNAELRQRLELVAGQVIEHQLTALSDVGTVERGSTLPEKIDSAQAHLMYGAAAVADPQFAPGEGTSRVCLSMQTTDDTRHYRQFLLELFAHDPATREVQVRFYASKVLTEEQCRQPRLDLEGNREVDTVFRVGLFDFPMIDNTRLSGGERSAVSVTALTPGVVSVAVAYFPASRASLKDKPFYDEIIRTLVPRQRSASLNQ
jgi:hypothetical protein